MVTPAKEIIMIQTIEHLSATRFKDAKFINAVKMFDQCKKAMPDLSDMDMEIYWDRALSSLLENQKIIRESWTDQNTDLKDLNTKIIDFQGMPVTHFRWEKKPQIKPQINQGLVKDSIDKTDTDSINTNHEYQAKIKELEARIKTLEAAYKAQLKEYDKKDKEITALRKKNKTLIQKNQRLATDSIKDQDKVSINTSLETPAKISLTDKEKWSIQVKKGKNIYIYAYKKISGKLYSVFLGKTWPGDDPARDRIREYKVRKGI